MWPQIALFAISLITFVQLFIPAHGRDETPRRNLRKLLCFPIFWLGLLLMIYILIQALNPAIGVGHKDVENWIGFSSTWWTYPIKHVDWLPSGVKAPFAYSNAWRALMNWATPLLALWTAWVGLTRRRSVVILFWLICLNGAAISLVGLAQQMTGTDLLLWNFDSSNPLFFGPFPYRNHAGAFMYPILALCLGMFFYYSQRARRRMQKSHPGIVFLLLGAVIAVALTAALSRGTVIMALAVLVMFLCLYFFRLVQSRSFGIFIAGSILLLVALAATIYGVMKFGDIERFEERFKSWSSSEGGALSDSSVQMRLMMAKATAEMYLDRPVYGWGAGSFQWAFRTYQFKKEYEPIWRLRWHRSEYGWREVRLRITHAHCDLLQFAAELGAVGGGFLVLIVLYLAGMLCYYIRALSCEHVMILSGCLLALVHASFEFNLSNPSVLLLVTLTTALTVIWMRQNPRFQQAEENT